MRTRLLLTLTAISLLLMPYVNFAQAPNLGTTSSYAFFTAAGAFTNISASTVVTGNVGTNVGAFSAFPPGTLVGQKHVADPASAQAAIDVANAYASLSADNCGQVLTTTLGNGQVLSPNVYCLGAASTLNGNLTLDGGGDPNAIFIFKINGALATSTLSTITLIGLASLCNVYWQVNGEVDLGDGSLFQGTIVADGAINLLGNSSLLGRGLTTAGAISLQDNVATVPVQPVASTISAGGATTFCQGGSVTLSGNIAGTWSNGASTPTITTDTSGDFFVTNTSNCGNAVSNHIIVTVNPLPDANAGSDAAICSGSNVTLGASPISGHTYLWTPATGLSSATIANPVASPAATTTYTLTETITATGCQNSNSVTVTVSPLPVTPVITAGGSTSFCGGGSVTLSGNTGGGTWSNGATTASITVSAAGSYSVTNTNACGSATSNVIVVTVNQPPVTPVITANGPTSFCSGGSVTLSGNTEGGTWSTGATTPTITVSAAGNYSLTITNACGSATSNVIVVTVNQPPVTPVITANGPVAFCSNGSVTLSGNTGGGTWSNGATTASITVSAAGSYSVTNTNACGSATSNVIVVTVNQPPVTPVITANGPTSFCSGGSVTLSGNTEGGTWSTGATTPTITVSAAGNYSLTITNACGSATSNVIVVTVNQPPVTPVITANGPVAFCSNGSVTLSGNTGGGTWSNGATTASITVSAAGSYSVTNTNACGSATSNVIVVTVNQPPVTPVITANGPTSFCSGGSVTLSGNTEGGTWSTGATTPTITVSAAGNYSLTITNACGSATSNVIVVTVNQPPVTPVITANGPVAFCSNGSVTLSGNSGGGTWSNGATTASITVSAAGSYSVTNTNACGSATSNVIVVTVNQPPVTPVITANGPTSFCSGGSVTLSGNTEGGTWSTGATTPTITVSAAGNYSLTITNACGSATSNVIVVTVNQPPVTPVITANGPVAFCSNGSVTLSGNSGGGTWSNGATTASITVSAAGSYSVTNTNACGSATSNVIVVTVNQPPVTPVITAKGPTSFCSGGSVTLSGNTEGGTWSTGATTPTITVSAAGNYSLTITNACGSATNQITVTVNPLPYATTGNSITICKGNSVTLGAASVSGHTYSWTPATGLSSSTISNPVASPTVTTTYTLTETITATGCQKSNSVTITISAPPVSTITGGTSICQGTPISLCAPAGCTTYLWSTGAKTSCISVSTAGTYSVTVSNAAGCTSSSSITITAGTPPTATTGSSTTICNGKSVTLGAASVSGHTYSWTPATGLSSSTISNPVASPTVTTTYTLTETITATGCQKSNSVTITISAPPVSTITGGTSICQGTPISLCAPAGCTTYLWSTGAKTSCISVSTAGTYSVTVSNAAGCTSSSSITITAGTPPTATTGSSTTICNGKSVTLGAASVSGHTYSWTPATGLSSSTISNPVASPTVTTTYTLTETITATGCQKSNSVTITISAPPVSTITGGTSICQGTPISLCAPAGCTTYLWSTGAKTSCISVSTAGTYSVTVSNAAGCTSSSSITITAGTPPTATTGSSTTICNGKSVTLGAASVSGHTYSWTPATGLSSSTISNPVASPTVTTTYTLTETITATGCQKSNSVTITISAPPVSTITGGTSICQGTPISLCAPAGCTTYLWSTGAKTSCISVSTAGTYSVTVSNAAGCTSSSSITITAGTPPTATTGSSTTICNGKSVTLGAASVSGHTYSWTPATGLSSSTISNPVASPTVTTTYTLTETITATGCQKSNSVTITISAPPVSTITGGTSICQGTPISLCAPAGCTTYLWSTGAKTSCISVSTAGTYSVTVSNAAGCTSSSSITITAGTPPTATTGSSTTICNGKSVTLGAASVSGHTYSWTPATGLSSSTISNPVASPTVTTTYTLTETITATGCQKSNSVTITISAPPVSTITGGTSICQGTPISLCAPAGCTTYLWSTGAKTSCISVSTAGTYSVTVSNAAGCTSSSSITITAGTPPTATTGSSTTICNGKSVTLGAASVSGHTYSWTPATGLSSSTISNPVASPTVTTTYTLTETITATGCQKSNSVTITISAPPVSTITGGTSICQGTPISLCAPAGCTTYLWSTGAKTSCISVSTAGTYSVTVSNAAGCTSSSSITITAGTPPTATTGSSTTICNGKSVTLGAASVSGHTYSWTPATGLSSSTISNPVASPTVTTTYTLTETITATGCQKSNSVTITIGAAPNCLISGNTTICQGQTTQLCAPAGCITYLWSTGAKTSCISVSTAGTYSVTVSNAGGCTSTCSKTVSVVQPPICTISGNNYCTKTQPSQLCASAGCSSYSWSTGASTSCIMVSNAGTYSCTVSNSNGCTSNGSKTVTINSQAAIIIGEPIDSSELKNATVQNDDSVVAATMKLEVFPNPTENFFTLIIYSDSRLDAEIRVFDVLGHALIHLRGTSGEQIRFGSQLVQGMYFIEVLQGNKRKVVKVIKI